MKTFKELRKEINESVISEADKNDQYVNDPWLGTKPFWQKAKQKVASAGQMIPGMNKPLKSQKPNTAARPSQTSSQPATSSGIEQRRSRAQELKQSARDRIATRNANPQPAEKPKQPEMDTSIKPKQSYPTKPIPDKIPSGTQFKKPAILPAKLPSGTQFKKPAILPAKLPSGTQFKKPAILPAKLPSGNAAKPATPKKTLPVSSPAMDDLRASAARMKSATADMASKTGALKSALTSKPRTDKPISPGGQSSSQVHSAISKLGGEPTKPVVSAAPKMSPTTPPRLSSSELKKNPSSGGGKWM